MADERVGPAPRAPVETRRAGRDHSAEIRRLTTLVEISQALAGTLDFKAGLHPVLEILERHHHAVRSSFTILQPETAELASEASIGLSAAGRRARYRLGEGVTGRVVESGRPVVVPQVSREPMFLRRADKVDFLLNPALILED